MKCKTQETAFGLGGDETGDIQKERALHDGDVVLEDVDAPVALDHEQAVGAVERVLDTYRRVECREIRESRCDVDRVSERVVAADPRRTPAYDLQAERAVRHEG